MTAGSAASPNPEASSLCKAQRTADAYTLVRPWVVVVGMEKPMTSEAVPAGKEKRKEKRKKIKDKEEKEGMVTASGRSTLHASSAPTK